MRDALRLRYFTLPLMALILIACSQHLFAVTISQFVGGPSFGLANSYYGHAATTMAAGGPWDNVTFNFFSNVPATTPVAYGDLFLLNQEYLGTPAALNSSTPGFIAQSQGIVDGKWAFPAGIQLQGNTRYFFYTNSGASVPVTGDDVLISDKMYYAPNANAPFYNGGTAMNFRVEGTPVPEPSAVFLLGFVALALVKRRR